MSFVLDLPKSVMENDELIADLCRFAEGVLTEKQVRQKWHLFEEAEWVTLGQSDELVEKIELEKTRRIRSGASKRELAQLHVTKGPAILDGIMTDAKQSAKQRIDAVKALDQLADNGPEAAADEDRFHIVINLGGDTKLTFDKSLRVDPNDNGGEIIDQAPQELPPPRRGPGRPKGSKNKPKIKEELLPYITNQQTDGGGGGENTL